MKNKSVSKLLVAMCSVAMLFTGLFFAIPKNTNAVEAAGTGETWVLNDYLQIYKGWSADDDISFKDANNNQYKHISYDEGWLTFTLNNNTEVYPYSSHKWDSAYTYCKTITFDSSVDTSSSLYTWLSGNATKQPSATAYSGDISLTVSNIEVGGSSSDITFSADNGFTCSISEIYYSLESYDDGDEMTADFTLSAGYYCFDIEIQKDGYYFVKDDNDYSYGGQVTIDIDGNVYVYNTPLNDTLSVGIQVQLEDTAGGGSQQSTTETWVFNDSISCDGFIELEYDFTSNGTNFIDLILDKDESALIYVYAIGDKDYYEVYKNNAWTNENYKTITLSTAATGDLLTFLEAYATKQESQSGGIVPSTGIYFDNAMMIGSGCVAIASLGVLAILFIKRKKFN